MSLVLTRLRADAQHPEMTVIIATTQAELEEVYRIRYQVYVEEMGILGPDHEFVRGNSLVDPFDGWSTNLLLRVGDEPAGTIRITERADGELEIDRYTDASASCPDPGRAAEITRLMVRQGFRGGLAGLLLMRGLWKFIQRSGIRYMLVAGKAGSLGRYYKRVCAGGLSVRPGSFCYGLTGCHYELLTVDFGEAWSPRRAIHHLFYGSLELLLAMSPNALRAITAGRRRARKRSHLQQDRVAA